MSSLLINKKWEGADEIIFLPSAGSTISQRSQSLQTKALSHMRNIPCSDLVRRDARFIANRIALTRSKNRQQNEELSSVEGAALALA